MKMLAKGSIGALLLAAAMSAAAFPVNVTSIDGTFENTTGNGVNGNGTSLISWGNGIQSSYEFTGATPLPVINDDSAFVLGMLTHTNNQVSGGTLTSADLAVTLGFSAAGITGAGEGEFVFTHNETPDTACTGTLFLGICWFGSFTGDVDDTITQTGASVTSSDFILGGVEYSLELLGLSADGSTPENTVQDYNLWARLNATALPVSVPEPGTLALLGLGLAGLGMARRRKA
ncbi:THxN family PEP-CTERM protein [Marinobacter salexigens]|uniref:THxN family PEP-CTERM protein n=1 Tax=Marinobacter salexigens TaxID=1925763 RepID=A0ABS6A4W8_9GAMM|nr:THxN family PEP-CTERM protein [Marinobacter salexigens]MBU2873243.1 THxN family PEP-CTERM protein [Marinobacter salexigens]